MHLNYVFKFFLCFVPLFRNILRIVLRVFNRFFVRAKWHNQQIEVLASGNDVVTKARKMSRCQHRGQHIQNTGNALEKPIHEPAKNWLRIEREHQIKCQFPCRGIRIHIANIENGTNQRSQNKCNMNASVVNEDFRKFSAFNFTLIKYVARILVIACSTQINENLH